MYGEWETTGIRQASCRGPRRANLLRGSFALIARYTLTARMFLFLCRVWPHARVASFDALPGALPASLLGEVASHAFAFHADESAPQNLVYEALAAVAVVLLWSCARRGAAV
jgi:uncharacterized BrkB/YihY/UPF0761 family membrane protein